MSNEPIILSMAEVLTRLRTGRVRVHALTSPVAAERTANTLLALGARPSLTANREEIAGFVGGCDALLINLGMLDAERRDTAPLAAALARQGGKPFVLDPVFVDVSGPRRSLAAELVAAGPTVVKLNRAEAASLLAIPATAVTVVTGAIDTLSQAGRTLRLANGHPLAGQVTATGCALGAVIAACLAVEPDAMTATAAALALYGIAAERAAEGATGPGSFAVRLIDALATLDPATLAERVRFA
ncbi:MAG TPA: hydroxyethylthiazole kinase [Beijerinckiaceae bacterium]|nr:hydroxyethylthiazole kinase [Beijerinckiaceae bacterium]